jgi:hypothetical protein
MKKYLLKCSRWHVLELIGILLLVVLSVVGCEANNAIPGNMYITGSYYSNGTEIGQVGEQGEKGDKGDTGNTGATGSSGATGAAGSNGTNGTNGTNGSMLSKQFQFNRDMSTVSGAVSFTGAGFQPTKLSMLCSINGTLSGSVGFSDSTGRGDCQYYYANPGLQTGQALGYVGAVYETTLSNYLQVSIQSYDSDGFTLYYTKGGSATSTANIIVSAEK